MTENLLSFLGLVLTVIFGVYSIWVYKKSKRKVSLEFKKQECYTLFRDDIKSLNIEISYNEKPLSSALILLKARLQNNGKEDIDQNRVYSPLKILCTEHFRWLEAKIAEQPQNAQTKATIINQSEVQIEWDLLKTNEYIDLELLVEIDHSFEEVELFTSRTTFFYNSIEFKHRITDLNTIQKEKVVNKFKSRNYLLYFVTIFGIILTLFSLGEYFDIFKFKIIRRDKVQYVIMNSYKSDSCEIRVINLDKVMIDFVSNQISKEMKIDEFNTNYQIRRIYTVKENGYLILYFLVGILYTSFGVFILRKRVFRTTNRKSYAKNMPKKHI